MEFEVHNRDGYFEVKTSGDAHIDGFTAFAKQVLSHKEWKPDTPVLFNHSDLNAGPLTVSDIGMIVDLAVKGLEHSGHGRWAVLASRDLEFGMARMWGMMIEDKLKFTPKAFRSRDEALSWLLGDV